MGFSTIKFVIIPVRYQWFRVSYSPRKLWVVSKCPVSSCFRKRGLQAPHYRKSFKFWAWIWRNQWPCTEVENASSPSGLSGVQDLYPSPVVRLCQIYLWLVVWNIFYFSIYCLARDTTLYQALNGGFLSPGGTPQSSSIIQIRQFSIVLVLKTMVTWGYHFSILYPYAPCLEYLPTF